jgi:hypothetical protein
MKKMFFCIFTFAICFSLKAQELELPNLSPQSPNAFQFTKYGEVNVNESTGAISPSIPLYSYKYGVCDFLNFYYSVINSFTITSSLGIEYHFSMVKSQPLSSDVGSIYTDVSSYVLTKIIDKRNI